MNKNIELRQLVANSSHKCDILVCDLVYNALSSIFIQSIFTQNIITAIILAEPKRGFSIMKTTSQVMKALFCAQRLHVF